MTFHPKDIFKLIKDTFAEFTDDKAPRLGAALAYYTIFSIAPLLMITLAIVGMVFHKEAAQGLIDDQLSHLIGKQGGEAVQSMIKGAGDTQKTGIVASLIGFVVLIFGASGVFVQLKDALNTIWDLPENKQGGGVMGFIKTRFLSFGLVLAVGFLLLVSLVISTLLSGLGKFMGGVAFLVPMLGMMNFLISFAVITGLFAMMFKWLPEIKIDWKDVWIGAALTSLLFTIGKSLLGLYLGRSSVASAYGAAGSLVVLLIWIYYSAQIMFFGAEFTQVYTRRHGSLVGAEEKKNVDVAAGSESAETAGISPSPRSTLEQDNGSKPSPPGMPAFATQANPAVELVAHGLTYGILAMLGLDAAKKAVGLAPAPDDPIRLGGAQSNPRVVADRVS